MSDACPCGRGLYQQCCQPLHLGVVTAQTAEQLMRSRYSAFAKHETDYIQKTTALGQQQALDMPAIREWSVSNQWLKLEIVQVNEKLDKNHALVEFKAHFNDGQQVHIHHEASHFVKHDGIWYFLDPTTEQKLTMKQPCVCGSDKKFKQCCAQFL
ncbi:preprotein translocase subunit SecA [Acinetobacter sp. NCu2D-2]|uniref:YchJ family protein n=1 Tax=Acinetobacter sp. NCu2D-2 TaxID=1608473 RepID=UPI0007CE0AE8|nr:YchJ family protein [Acinetobacter sp. NCu2D-2]ANF82793.1 preprotein translocase subunit SecA [Acinetobacter sp. NCu2D-2]